jgi:peptidoglycan hydrolase-like protein with peptidoglycan-binding domain
VLRLASVSALALVGCLALAPAADARRSANVAALQVAMRALGLYDGDVDGLGGPATTGAVRRFQLRAGLAADGVPGLRTRRALGRRGWPVYGSRAMSVGDRGWDVAALQFKLALHGFPSGAIDGGFGTRTAAAVRRFQRFAGLAADGVAGRATLRALRRPRPRSPFRFSRPIRAPMGDRFGPRGARLHAGLDFPAPTGRLVVAGRGGRVVTAGWLPSGWGNSVIIAHGRGVRTLHAHLSSVLVRPGQLVKPGRALGRVGATGTATGPHLHWEVFVRGANTDPARALR